MRADVLAIVDAALAAVHGTRATRRALPELRGRRVWVVGAGKAAAHMAVAVEEACEVVRGCVAVKDGHGLPLRMEVREAGHPLPDPRSVAAAEVALEIAAEADDLLLVLLSGGASALWTCPPEGVSLVDLRRTNELLLRSGAPIGAINTVRRHVSRIANGRLAAATRADVVTLVLSDVPGPAWEVGSGPTWADGSSAEDARAVLREWAPRAEIGEIPPSPSVRAPLTVVADHHEAVAAAGREAERRGYAAFLWPTVTGDAEAAVDAHLRLLDALPRPCALISGGEATVRVTGDGRGGRNTHFAAVTAGRIAGRDLVLVAAATDGTDGPTDAAGAIVDGATGDRSDAVARCDSYGAVELLKTGPTGTNVMDLRVFLARR